VIAPRRMMVTLALLGGFVLLCGTALVALLGLTFALRESPAGCQAGQATTLPAGSGTVVGATVYDDPGSGAYGLGLAGHLPYAELGLWSATDTDRAHANLLGSALGLGRPLAPLTALTILGPRGRRVRAQKRDIGRGQGSRTLAGHAFAIDLWTTTRIALGLAANWSGLVRVSAGANGLTAEASTANANADPGASLPGGGCSSGSVEIDPGAQSIVRIAQRELASGASVENGLCLKYGPCTSEAWCALFATWVWRQAGVRIPSMAASNEPYLWAASHTHAYGPDTAPRPGWMAFFGSGPQDTSTSLHVGIVEKVLSDGEITLINGNFHNGHIVRTGPCAPAQAQGACYEPGPIYGYASPTR